jgi:hypothetical protein
MIQDRRPEERSVSVQATGIIFIQLETSFFSLHPWRWLLVCFVFTKGEGHAFHLLGRHIQLLSFACFKSSKEEIEKGRIAGRIIKSSRTQ